MQLLQSFFNMAHWLTDVDSPRPQDDLLSHPDIISMTPWQLADLPLSRPGNTTAHHADPATGPSSARDL